MSYVGDFRLGDTFDVKFTTRQISGAPFTLAGSPVICAYVGNGVTELTAGITLSVDFDARTGLNHVRVVATNANGYTTASDYQLVITAGSVNSVSVVGEVIAEFSIEHRSALMPTTAARTAAVDASGLIDANAVKVGPTGAGTAQTAKDLGASATQTGDSYGRIGAPAGISVSADVAAIKTDTVAIKSKTDNLPSDPASAGTITAAFNAVPAAVWALVIDGTNSAIRLMRGLAATMLGKASGLDANAPKYRNLADTKDVVSATTDVNGNRATVTLDLT
jgi:hypothetical protein